MDRRSFLTAGTGLVAAGAAATAALTSNSGAALAAGSATTPTVYTFGAVGDGYTDDSAAFSKALQWASQNAQCVIVPAGIYGIANTINWVSNGANVGQGWGLICQGATLMSRITNGSDVMALLSNGSSTVRYFKLIGSLSIVGSGNDANGLHIMAPSNTAGFYNFLVDGLSVERCGKNGLVLDGDVFECTISNSYFQDMKQDGAQFGNRGGGVVSTVNIVNCFFNQNGRYGFMTLDYDNQYGGPYDVRVYGGYARNNQSFGFYYNNGDGGGSIINVGFENNCQGLALGDKTGGHVYAGVKMNMRDCVGFAEMAASTYLLQGWWMQRMNIDNCTNWCGGATASAGGVKLVNMNGNSSAAVVMNNCSGGFDGAWGSGVKWFANNCDGPSPWGNLNPIGSMSGTF
jgi:hypothetical protein